MPPPTDRRPDTNVTYADLRDEWASAAAEFGERDGDACLRILDREP